MRPKTADALQALLDIVTDEYARDPEPEDLPSWKKAIELGAQALLDDPAPVVVLLKDMKLEADKPDDLKKRMTVFDDALDEYMRVMGERALGEGELGEGELQHHFAILYDKVANIFEAQIGDLALGHLNAQHRSYLENLKLRKELAKSCEEKQKERKEP